MWLLLLNEPNNTIAIISNHIIFLEASNLLIGRAASTHSLCTVFVCIVSQHGARYYLECYDYEDYYTVPIEDITLS